MPAQTYAFVLSISSTAQHEASDCGISRSEAPLLDPSINIFISYAQPDYPFVERLKGDLGQQGFGTIVDRQALPVGQRWRRALQAALDGCQVLLVVLSPEAVASQEVQSEYSYALEEGKVVIPLSYRPCKVPLVLRSLQRINFQENYEQGLAVLVPALQQVARMASSKERKPEPEAERPWNVPYARNPFFTGRGQLLERLHEQVARSHNAALNQSYALSGLGGIGKTQMAIEYAYRYRQEYSSVFWVRAANRETLLADYVALAHLLQLSEQDAPDQMLIVAAVKRWLEQHQDWLLILDNADELSLLADFLPAGGQGHLLLTTRSQATGKIAQSLPVEKMELSEGMQLLLRRAKLLATEEPLDNLSAALRRTAQQLVQELDGLPLALDQAGAYIEETGCSLSEYLALYGQHRLALLQQQSSVTTDYPHTVASTWALSFAQVEQQSPAAADLLRLCAFLHPDAIPEAIVTEGAADLGPLLSRIAADPLLLNAAIQVLRRYSLVKRDPEARQLNIHRLVQVVLKESLDAQAQQQWAERSVRAVSRAFPEVEFATWELCELCLPHAQVCVTYIDKWHMFFPEASQLLNHTANYLQERALYKGAEFLYLRALAIREQTLGIESLAYAASLNDLASLYTAQGRYKEAEPLYQRAIALQEQALGVDHSDTADSFAGLAKLYHEQGKFEQAESLYRRALAIRERESGSNSAVIATILNNLAHLYYDQGKFEQAELLHQRALTIREQRLGANHPDVAISLFNLGLLYYEQGKYEQAEPLYYRALQISEHTRGSNHPDVAFSLNNLALLYWKQGKYEQAEPLYQRALALFESALGPNHSDVATCLNNLAKLYHDQRRYAEAEALHQRALSIREQELGSNHPDVAFSLNNLALLYEDQGKHEQSKLLHQRALAIREQRLGANHPLTATSLNNLARLYHHQGKFEQAEPLYQRAHSIREQALGLEHPDTVKVREDYTELLRTMQEQEAVMRQQGAMPQRQ